MLFTLAFFALAGGYLVYFLIQKFVFLDDSFFIFIYGILAILCLISAFAFLSDHTIIGWIFGGINIGALILEATALAVITGGKNQTAIIEPAEWIVVLGCALAVDQKPGVILTARLQKALTLHNRYPQTPIVVCGGQGADEALAEANAMSLYLQEQGVPAKLIIPEDTSSTTKEALEHFVCLCKNPSAQAIIVTSDFHAMRTEQAAKSCGLTSFTVVSGKTPAIRWINFALREACAVLASKLLPNLHNIWIMGRRL